MPVTTTLWNVQEAVYDCLCQSPDLTALLAEGAEGVRDFVPPDMAFPYLVIGDVAAAPLDTATYHGLECTVTLHSYSRALGMKEIKHITAAISAALHEADLDIDGHSAVLCQEKDLTALLESDGETRHAIQRFRIIAEPL